MDRSAPPRHRPFAVVLVAVLPLILAACTEQYPMDLQVRNVTDHPETLVVLIHTDNGTVLYNRTFHMDAHSTTGRFRPDIPQGVHQLTVVWRDTHFEVTRRFEDGAGGVGVTVFRDRLEIAGGGGIDRFDHPPPTTDD